MSLTRPSGEVRRLRLAVNFHVSIWINRKGAGNVFVVAAKICRVNKLLAIRAYLGDEPVRAMIWVEPIEAGAVRESLLKSTWSHLHDVFSGRASNVNINLGVNSASSAASRRARAEDCAI